MLNIAIAYTARDEMLRAMNMLCHGVDDGAITPECALKISVRLRVTFHLTAGQRYHRRPLFGVPLYIRRTRPRRADIWRETVIGFYGSIAGQSPLTLFLALAEHVFLSIFPSRLLA